MIPCRLAEPGPSTDRRKLLQLHTPCKLSLSSGASGRRPAPWLAWANRVNFKVDYYRRAAGLQKSVFFIDSEKSFCYCFTMARNDPGFGPEKITFKKRQKCPVFP